MSVIYTHGTSGTSTYGTSTYTYGTSCLGALGGNDSYLVCRIAYSV